MNETLPIPAGALFTVTTGEYSDYVVLGVFRALREFNPDVLLNQWLHKHPDQREYYSFSEQKFLAEMVREGHLEPVESGEWHLDERALSSHYEPATPAPQAPTTPSQPLPAPKE